jgi:hypothetical protein
MPARLPSECRRRPDCSRLAAALCASVLAHAWIALESPRAQRITLAHPSAPSVLSARLVSLPPKQEPAEAKPLAIPAVRGNASRSSLRRAGVAHGKNAPVAAPAVPQGPAILPQVADPNYYTARDIDVYPVLLAPRGLPETVDARRRWHGGHGVVMLRIDEIGRVTRLEILEADPRGAFEDYLRSSFSGATFTAARRNGRSVKSEIVVRVSVPHVGPADRNTASTGEHSKATFATKEASDTE